MGWIDQLFRAAKVPGAIAVVGVVLLASGSEVGAAQIFAVAVILFVTLLLYTTGPKRAVALRNLPGVEVGLEVPATVLAAGEYKEGEDYKYQRGLFFRGLVLGKDGRWSTSKLQALLWTYALLFALTSIFLADSLGADEGLRNLKDQESADWDIYLILLGGPFAALVLAEGITSSKVAQGKTAKTPTKPTGGIVPGLKEVISNDGGETDLVDLQYFLFNVLALLVFTISFVPNLADGLPVLPSFLAVLTGASAATYVGNKVAADERPSITAVLPATAGPGDELDIWGHSLALGQPGVEDREPKMSIGTTRITDVRIVDDALSGLDHLRCKLPEDADFGPHALRLVNRAGASVESPLQVVDPNAEKNAGGGSRGTRV